jgi:hypothetical protein
MPVRVTRVVLVAAHLDHDPAHYRRRHRNVRALCQRCPVARPARAAAVNLETSIYRVEVGWLPRFWT